MRHTLLFLLILGAGYNSFSQKPIRKGMPPITTIKKNDKAYYSISQLSGKWQEITRFAQGSKNNLAFTDTMLLQFDSNKVLIKDATSMRMTMKGDVFIDPPYNLVAAGDEFVIRSLSKNKMILEEADFVREFQKKDQFYFETLGKLTVPVDTFRRPESIDQKLLEGKWLVYRRQALAGSVDSGAVIIKSLNIFPGNTIGSAAGEVVCYKSDITETLPCKVVFNKSDLLVITDKYVWQFNTYKGNGNEFVFGEKGSLLYYAKKL